ncbi:hypothetical protein J518_1300 [Acinetobacter baumannii 1419130]|nr:hypothetical protein J518_1300 [Acinetobacter baumannii 1419130]
MCSWRHTPFRNVGSKNPPQGQRSWRHTPFRKLEKDSDAKLLRSWRHTPFRNNSFLNLSWL